MFRDDFEEFTGVDEVGEATAQGFGAGMGEASRSEEFIDCLVQTGW
jgi:hypothetical protein